MLAVGSKPGGPFKPVGKAPTARRDNERERHAGGAKVKPAASKKRAQARKPAQAQTSKRQSTKPKPTRSR
jgi:hypothetical protein